MEKLQGGEIITTFEKRILEQGRTEGIELVSQQIAEMQQQTIKRNNLKQFEDVFKTQEQKRLEGKLKDYKRLYSLTGKDFKILSRELGINKTELQYRRSYAFRTTYMRIMKENYSNYQDYWLLKKWADRHRDPVRFFQALPDGEFYPDDIQYQSDNVIPPEKFASFLEELGIDVEEEYKKEAQRRGMTVEELKMSINEKIKERQEKQ